MQLIRRYSIFLLIMLLVKMARYLCIFFVLIIISIFSCRSKTHSVKTVQADIKDTFENSLVWISMIDSPGVNYYKAVEAFNKYWEHREKPTEKDGEGKDLFGEQMQENGSNGTIPYVYEYKRFLNWQQRNKNLVKPDGTVMTPEEVLELWKKLQTDSLSNKR